MVSDWEVSTLGELAEIVMGQSPKGADCNSDGHGTPLLNGPTEFGSNHPHPTQFTTHPKKFSKKDDLLFCVRGSTTGRMNWSDKEYAIGRGLAAFRHKKGKEFQSFLKGVIDIKLPELLASATGSTFPNVSKNQLNDLEVILPPLIEQKAIAHILGSLEDKIELNRQINETLEAMAQALFKSWFVDFDPVIDNVLAAGNAIPDEMLERAKQRKGIEKKDNADIQDLFPDEFEFTEEIGWIPKGWAVDSVENLIEINPRITLKKGTVAPHADMKALPESGYSIDGVVQKAYSGGTKFENRDVLFARITPCLENGKTGLVDFLKPKEVGFGSTEFIVLREKDDIKMEFVACLARNSEFRLHAQQSMVGSSGRQRVQNACFSSFYLALPKDNGKLLKLFNETTAVNFDNISILANECQTLAKLRDTLLPKLMSGEVRIPDAEALVENV